MRRRKLCYAGLVALAALTVPALAQDARQSLIGNLSADVEALKNDIRHIDNSAGILAKFDAQELADRVSQVAWWQDCAKKPECWEWVKPAQ